MKRTKQKVITHSTMAWATRASVNRFLLIGPISNFNRVGQFTCYNLSALIAFSVGVAPG